MCLLLLHCYGQAVDSGILWVLQILLLYHHRYSTSLSALHFVILQRRIRHHHLLVALIVGRCVADDLAEVGIVFKSLENGENLRVGGEYPSFSLNQAIAAFLLSSLGSWFKLVIALATSCTELASLAIEPAIVARFWQS